MSIKSKLAALALATVAVTGAITSTTTQAHAGPNYWVGPAIVGAAIVGTAVAASAANNGGYYYGPRHCFWQARYGVYGQYLGNVRVCNF